jgi:hypothetical protein
MLLILLHQEYRDKQKTMLLKTALRDYTYLFLAAMSMKRPPPRYKTATGAFLLH